MYCIQNYSSNNVTRSNEVLVENDTLPFFSWSETFYNRKLLAVTDNYVNIFESYKLKRIEAKRQLKLCIVYNYCIHRYLKEINNIRL